MAEEEMGPGGRSLSDYPSYEDFLDSFVAPLDRAFLGDVHLGRFIVELGYRGPREGFSREKFDNVRQKIEDRKRAAMAMLKTVISAGRKYEESAYRALQQREEANRIGKQASVIFIRTKNNQNQEISGYIDYAHRLVTEDFTPIFDEKEKLMPKEIDLSFYNWETTVRKGRSTPNYVIVPTTETMILRNRRDGKLMYVDPSSNYVGENSSRTVVPTKMYISMIVFDHYNRRRV